jgi:hypothetical protein
MGARAQRLQMSRNSFWITWQAVYVPVATERSSTICRRSICIQSLACRPQCPERPMAAHTPVIGLRAMARDWFGEWRVLGRECGWVRVKVVVGWTEVDVGASGVTMALPRQAEARAPALRFGSCELRDSHDNKVKGDNSSSRSPARTHARLHREGMILQPPRASSPQPPLTQQHATTLSHIRPRRHAPHYATARSTCQALSTRPAPAVWAHPQA